MRTRLFVCAALLASVASAADAAEKYLHFKIEDSSRNVIATTHKAGDPASKVNKEPVTVSAYDGDATQLWRLKPQADGAFTLENVHSGKVLCTDVNSGDPKSRNKHQRMLQYDYYGDSTQRWRLTRTRSGKFRLESMHSGMALTPAGLGQPLVQDDYNPQQSRGGQLWTLTLVGVDP